MGTGTGFHCENERRHAITGRARIKIVLICLIVLATRVLTGHLALAEDLKSKASSLTGEESPWSITADSLQFNEEEHLYIAKGEVTITNKE